MTTILYYIIDAATTPFDATHLTQLEARGTVIILDPHAANHGQWDHLPQLSKPLSVEQLRNVLHRI
jgi:hypothetical protein